MPLGEKFNPFIPITKIDFFLALKMKLCISYFLRVSEIEFNNDGLEGDASEIGILLQGNFKFRFSECGFGRVKRIEFAIRFLLFFVESEFAIKNFMFGKFAQEYNVILVLKGARSVIADPNGQVYINPTGNSGMASAGVGDVLTGLIAGFLGQKVSPIHSALLGVYLHGLAADLAAEQLTQYSLIASDIIDFLPKAIKSVL